MRMNLDHVASSDFVPGRDVHCEFADYWPLVLSTVGSKIKFMFRFRTMVILRYELSSKNGVKFLLRKRSTHRFYSFPVPFLPAYF